MHIFFVMDKVYSSLAIKSRSASNMASQNFDRIIGQVGSLNQTSVYLAERFYKANSTLLNEGQFMQRDKIEYKQNKKKALTAVWNP